MAETILSVEGGEAIWIGRNTALRQAGFEVIEAAIASDIPRIALLRRPDLILLPTEAERTDGFALCWQLKADSRTATIPVLHISSGDGYAASLDSGAEGYVPATVRPEALAAIAGALIRASAAAHKRAKSALRESERIFRAIGESIDYGVWVCTPDGRNTYVSDSFLKLVGLTQEQCSSFGWGSALAPEDAENTIAAWKKCVAAQGRWDREHRFRGADGEIHPVLSRGAPVRDEHGEIICWAGINLDIGALKRTEEFLRASESRERARAAELVAIMDAAPVAIFIAHDATCRRISGNRMAYALLRAEPGSNLSKSAQEGEGLSNCRFTHDGVDIPTEELPVQRAAFTGKPVRNCEMEVMFEDGEPLSLLGDALPMLDENGRSRGAVGVLIDITERKRAEERLRQAQKLESLGLMAGGVAHDFNNLLVGVIGNASLAYGMVAPDHLAARLMARVVKAGEKAAHLTRQMLAYSGKGGFVVEPMNLSEMVSEMSELIQPSIPRKVTLRLELDPELPSIEADRGQLDQVLMNLVLNASEAIGNNAGCVTVRTGVQEVDEAYIKAQRDLVGTELHPGEYVCLEVTDNGCGMDEATTAKIFDPFFSTKFTGRGLGLAAVSGILRGHKGTVKVSSKLGEGSCFTVLFPAIPHRKSSGTAAAEALKGTGTILVVDDEEVVREMSKLTLEGYGYRVLLADSGLAALDMFKRHAGDIALVVLDLTMPGMSGEEALPELRKIRPDVRVVVSSGYSEGATRDWLHGQSVAGFIQKPYTPIWLAEQVKSALG